MMCCVLSFSRLAVLYLSTLILLNDNNTRALEVELSDASAEFSKYKIVHPTIHHARTKREINTTRHTEGFHHPEVTMRVTVDDEEYVLDLTLNEDLFPEGHVLSYEEDGRQVQRKPSKLELDICQYSGTVRDKPGSWAAVSTCRGVSGVIFDGKRMRYIQPAIEPAHDNQISMGHYIYDHSDLKSSYTCGTDDSVDVTDQRGLKSSHNYDESFFLDESLHHQDMYSMAAQHIEGDEIHSPFNSDVSSRYVELVLVADHGTYKRHKSLDAVHQHMKNLANIINSLYSPLNIFIALIGVVVWNHEDQIAPRERDSGSILDTFLEYRQKTLNRIKENDNAFLITTREFDGSVVGKAFIDSMCSATQSGGIAYYYSSVDGLLASTVAHELGHNFGLQHDNKYEGGCDCQDRYCVMSASISEDIPVRWSKCSRNLLATSADKKSYDCLRNKPKKLYDSPTCGNGFVEPGEECDCGLQADKREPKSSCHNCCDAKTCKLKPHASCASGECCDRNTCRVTPSGKECRAAVRECGLPEYCTGHSEFCPEDVHKTDTTPCGKRGDEAFCMNGFCHTHTDKCRLFWGPTAINAINNCYSGCQRRDGQPCTREDSLCGKLRCRNTASGYLVEETTGMHSFFTVDGEEYECSYIVDHLFSSGKRDSDRGLVPDGAKCGTNKMCLNQRCVSVAPVPNMPSDTIPDIQPEQPPQQPYIPPIQPTQRPTTKRPIYQPTRRSPIDRSPNWPTRSPPFGPRPTQKPPLGQRPTQKPPLGQRPTQTPPLGHRPILIPPFDHPTSRPPVFRPREGPLFDHPTSRPPVFRPREGPLFDHPTSRPPVFRPREGPSFDHPTSRPPVLRPREGPSFDHPGYWTPIHLPSDHPPKKSSNRPPVDGRFDDHDNDIENSDGNSSYMIAIYVIFLGVLPLVLLILLLVYYKRNRHSSFFIKYPTINNTLQHIHNLLIYKSDGNIMKGTKKVRDKIDVKTNTLPRRRSLHLSISQPFQDENTNKPLILNKKITKADITVITSGKTGLPGIPESLKTEEVIYENVALNRNDKNDCKQSQTIKPELKINPTMNNQEAYRTQAKPQVTMVSKPNPLTVSKGTQEPKPNQSVKPQVIHATKPDKPIKPQIVHESKANPLKKHQAVHEAKPSIKSKQSHELKPNPPLKPNLTQDLNSIVPTNDRIHKPHISPLLPKDKQNRSIQGTTNKTATNELERILAARKNKLEN